MRCLGRGLTEKGEREGNNYCETQQDVKKLFDLFMF